MKTICINSQHNNFVPKESWIYFLNYFILFYMLEILEILALFSQILYQKNVKGMYIVMCIFFK